MQPQLGFNSSSPSYQLTTFRRTSLSGTLLMDYLVESKHLLIALIKVIKLNCDIDKHIPLILWVLTTYAFNVNLNIMIQINDKMWNIVIMKISVTWFLVETFTIFFTLFFIWPCPVIPWNNIDAWRLTLKGNV